jgi:hypothetical protein
MVNFRFMLIYALLIAAAQSLALIARMDFRRNHVATDRNWFYLAVPPGGGVPYAINQGGSYWDEFGEKSIGSTSPTDAPAVVYTRGDELKARFFIDNAGGGAHSGTVTITAAEFPGLPVWFEPETASYTVSANGTTWSNEVTLGTIPGFVDAHLLSMQITVKDSGNNVLAGGIVETVCYAIFNDPVLTQEPVWLELVMYTTDWANGADSEDEVIDACTFGLYGLIFLRITSAHRQFQVFGWKKI